MKKLIFILLLLAWSIGDAQVHKLRIYKESVLTDSILPDLSSELTIKAVSRIRILGNLIVPNLITGDLNISGVYKINGTALAKGNVGLGNVDNTSDVNKPVSTATQTALNLKENTANKDATYGYVGLENFQIKFLNENTGLITSYFKNLNSDSRTYDFQDRDGLIMDQHNVDELLDLIALKQDLLTVTTIGATPNANGMTLSGPVLNLQPASVSFGGIVTTGTQVFAGKKTFDSGSEAGLPQFKFTNSSAYTRVMIDNTNGTPNTGFELGTGGVAKWGFYTSGYYGGSNPDFLVWNTPVGAPAFHIDGNTNNINIGGAYNAVPTSKIHIVAGTTVAGTNPLKYTSGPLNTAAEVGAEEFLTDKRYFTITTGSARKEYTLNDIALTSGRVPFTTTNGRLTDLSTFTFASSVLTVPEILLGTVKILKGTGTPESVVTAPVGSIFLRTDGGASTTLYVKQTGTGNTGWGAK